MKNFPLYFFLTILTISPIGCASVGSNLPHGLTPKSSISSLRDYQEWSLSSVEKLNIYLNKSKENLRLGMGEPTYIKYNIIDSRKHYDEIWVYHYSKGIPLVTDVSWDYTFYIINNVVVNIEAQ